ncbi:MAG: DUF1634 domain-containing protein [Thermoplasmataceae archaeon]
MKEIDIYKLISATLRAGVLLSISSLIAGVVLMFVRGGADGYTIQQISYYSTPPPTNTTLYSKLIPLNNIFAGIYHLNGAYFVSFGLWVLIFTPITVVFFSLISFVRERNALYIILSSAVLFVLFFAMLVVPHFVLS